jgi:hypothetical protein
LVGLVRRGTLVRPYPGASVGRLQCCWSRAGEQGRRQHPNLARTFLPSGPVKDIRTRTLPEKRRQPPRLFTHFTLYVLHRRRRGGRVQGPSEQRDARASGHLPASVGRLHGQGACVRCFVSLSEFFLSQGLNERARCSYDRLQKRNTCSITSSRSCRPNSVPWTAKSSTRTSIASRTLSATSRPALRAARRKVYR